MSHRHGDAASCVYSLALLRFSLCEERFTMLVNSYTLLSNDLEGRIQSALAAMRAGVPVILLDDFDRENEADLILSAEKLTNETMAMMIRECSGIVCLCLPTDVVSAWNCRPCRPTTAAATARRSRSPSKRAKASRRACRPPTASPPSAPPSPGCQAVRPGASRPRLPLRAAPGGVLERRGHTEGSVDLSRLAGLNPAAVLCELMNPDGTMMRGDDIERFAELHGMPILTIEELVEWRSKHSNNPSGDHGRRHTHVAVDEAGACIRGGDRRVGQRQAQRPVLHHVHAAHQGHAHQRADLPVRIQGRRRAVRMLLAGHQHHGGRHGGNGDADGDVHDGRAQRQQASKAWRDARPSAPPCRHPPASPAAWAGACHDAPQCFPPSNSHRISRHHGQQAQARLQGIRAARCCKNRLSKNSWPNTQKLIRKPTPLAAPKLLL
jgi:3,4-dihydroxy 2-butanone 4-phosphate synthase